MTEELRSNSFRAPMRRVLVACGVGFGVAIPVATVVGWLAGGSTVGLGLLLGLAVPALFFGLTVLAGVLAARLDNGPFVGVVMGSWLLKVLALMLLMAAIRDAEFYDSVAFFAGFVCGVVGWLAAEIVVVLRAKTPYVEVSGGA